MLIKKMSYQSLNSSVNQVTDSGNNTPSSSHLQKILYALGSIPSSAIYSLLSTWLVYCYFPPKGWNESTLEISKLVSQNLKWSFAITPIIFYLIVGHLSDVSRFKIGRRIPFLFVGAISSTILFTLFWILPKNSPVNTQLIYFCSLSILYSISQVIFFCPYISLFPEIAKTPRERIGLSIYLIISNIIGLLISFTFAAKLIENYGYILMGISVSIFSLILMMLSILGSYKFDKAIPSEVKSCRFFDSLLGIFKNRAFLFFILFICSWNLSGEFILRFMSSFLEAPMKETKAADYSVGLLIGILAIPFILHACYKIKWERIFRTLLILTLAIFPIGFLISKLAFLSETYPIVISIVFSACLFPYMAIGILSDPIVANFVDQDTKKSEFQRAGIFFGGMSSITKAASQLSILFVMGILKLSNFIEGDKFGYTSGIVGLLTIILAIYIFSKCSLGKMDINNKM